MASDFDAFAFFFMVKTLLTVWKTVPRPFFSLSESLELEATGAAGVGAEDDSPAMVSRLEFAISRGKMVGWIYVAGIKGPSFNANGTPYPPLLLLLHPNTSSPSQGPQSPSSEYCIVLMTSDLLLEPEDWTKVP